MEAVKAPPLSTAFGSRCIFLCTREFTREEARFSAVNPAECRESHRPNAHPLNPHPFPFPFRVVELYSTLLHGNAQRSPRCGCRRYTLWSDKKRCREKRERVGSIEMGVQVRDTVTGTEGTRRKNVGRRKISERSLEEV